MDLGIHGKNILITGSSKGIGRALAFQAAKEGANIVLHYNRSENESRITEKEIEQLGVKVILDGTDIFFLTWTMSKG